MINKPQKEVGKDKQRNYALRIAKFWLGEKKTVTKRAKTLTPQDLKKVLDYINQHKHALRNRTILLTGYFSGMRVGELANLRYVDVVDAEGRIRDEILLEAEQTKGRYARTVFISAKLKQHLEIYIQVYKPKNTTDSFFYTQKKQKEGFTPNTLAQYFHYLYKKAGIIGASSHSLRRSFITNLASKGIGVRVLMSLAGHRHIGTTQIYIDNNDDMNRKAVNLL